MVQGAPLPQDYILGLEFRVELVQHIAEGLALGRELASQGGDRLATGLFYRLNFLRDAFDGDSRLFLKRCQQAICVVRMSFRSRQLLQSGLDKLAVLVYLASHGVVSGCQNTRGILYFQVGIADYLELVVHVLASSHHFRLEVAVVFVSPRELFMYELHQVGHAIFSVSQLFLQPFQICPDVERSILLH